MSSGAISYYAEDFIGSSRVITTSAGATCYDADFYPYGAESNVTNTCPQNYKWTGKERDAETGNDDFDARYYSSVYGRFLSADWSAVPAAVPYANLTNPQTLNLYAIVRDNPESYADLDGHVLQEKQEDKDLENEIREEAEREREIEQAESRMASEADQKEEAARRDWESKQPNGFDDPRTGVCYAPIDTTPKMGPNKFEDTPANRARLNEGKPPIGADGKPLERHHEDQTMTGPKKVLTRQEHREGENFSKNHPNTGQRPSKIDRNEAAKENRQFWKGVLKQLEDQ